MSQLKNSKYYRTEVSPHSKLLQCSFGRFLEVKQVSSLFYTSKMWLCLIKKKKKKHPHDTLLPPPCFTAEILPAYQQAQWFVPKAKKFSLDQKTNFYMSTGTPICHRFLLNFQLCEVLAVDLSTCCRVWWAVFYLQSHICATF